MLQAKEGGRDVLRGGLRFFALFPSAVLLWAEQSPAPAGAIRLFCRGGALPRPTEGFFPRQKELLFSISQLLLKIHQHLGKRAAGRGLVCADGAVTVRGDRAGLHGPEHRLLRPRTDGAAVAPCGEIARSGGVRAAQRRVAAEDHGGLLTGDRLVGTERAVTVADDQPALRCPADGLRRVGVGGEIGEVHVALGGGAVKARPERLRKQHAALTGMVWETAGGSGVGSVASGVTETAVSTTAGVSTTATVSATGAVVSAQARKGAAESALLSPVRFTGTKLHTVLPSLEGV